MAKELLILDSSAAMNEQKEILPGVPEFLKSQSRSEWFTKGELYTKTRECVMTSSDGVVEKDIAKIKGRIGAFYNKNILTNASKHKYTVYSHNFALLAASELGGQRTMAAQYYLLYQNPFRPGFLEKDLHLVRNLYLSRYGRSYLRISNGVPGSSCTDKPGFPSCRVIPTQRAVFVGSKFDVGCAATDPTLPNILTGNNDWGQRRGVEALTDTLFKDDPADVFDELYASGRQNVAYQDAYRKTDGNTDTTREINVEDFRFRISRVVNGLEARVIQELV